MNQIDIVIQHTAGLHARPATLFVQTAQRFKSDISVTYNNKSVNGKSILGMLNLGATKDACIHINATGDDEDLAINELKNLIESDFFEK